MHYLYTQGHSHKDTKLVKITCEHNANQTLISFDRTHYRSDPHVHVVHACTVHEFPNTNTIAICLFSIEQNSRHLNYAKSCVL